MASFPGPAKPKAPARPGQTDPRSAENHPTNIPRHWQTAAQSGIWLHGLETSQGRRSVPDLVF